MNSGEIRKKFLEFFRARGHAVVPSSSLIPDDPSVLLTTAGMQQFKKYFTGELDPIKDFGKSSVTSVQKSFRTSDIDEVGDESHLTFFEMLGNFSFGEYFKEGAIKYAYEFITKELRVPIDYVSVFEGNRDIPADEESGKIWKSIGVSDVRMFGKEDNFWGPTGKEGPCGPTSEIYVKNAEGKSIEIWNLVFNEYYCHPDGKLEKLKTPGIDTGMGFERLMMVIQNVPTIFETDLFTSIAPPDLSKMKDERIRRIILDHGRAAAFLISDGVRPSNKERGYVLRRLIRRMMAHVHRVSQNSLVAEDSLGNGFADIENILVATVKHYKPFYGELDEEIVLGVFSEEAEKFKAAMRNGLRELKKLDFVDAMSAFKIYESHGLTYEVIKDFAGARASGLTREEFDRELEKHQEISRAGREKKFGGHGLLLDTGEIKAGSSDELKKVTRLHTATHLLQWALRRVLGNGVMQAGSDITANRTRFDFTFPRKMTAEELARTENLVNEKIRENLPVHFKEMRKTDAEKTGALHFFGKKYPDIVKVYFIGGSGGNEAVSSEFCGGPHVRSTADIGKFVIIKEESIGSNIRRIRAKVE